MKQTGFVENVSVLPFEVEYDSVAIRSSICQCCHLKLNISVLLSEMLWKMVTLFNRNNNQISQVSSKFSEIFPKIKPKLRKFWGNLNDPAPPPTAVKFWILQSGCPKFLRNFFETSSQKFWFCYKAGRG